MKIIDRPEVKIYEFKYSADGGSLQIAQSKNTRLFFTNHTGDGGFKFYIVNTVGWGPVHFNNKDDYEELKKFENKFKNSKSLTFLKDNNWKVLLYDLLNYDDSSSVELKSSKNFISIDRYKDVFIIYVYQNNISDVEKYDKYILDNNQWEY